MLSSLAILASATLAAAWPAVLYSDVNCTSVVAAYSHLPENVCINTNDVQSYRGSLGSSKEELLIYKDKKDCDHSGIPAAFIEGSAQSCIFIYKDVGPFGAAKVVHTRPETLKLSLSQQD